MATSPQIQTGTAAAEWRTARRLYAIYSGVIARFDVGVEACPELESPIDRHDYGVRSRVRSWLSLMDNHCPVPYLRQVLQCDPVGNETNLRALIRRHLDRSHKTEFDREKLDFLLVQYFEHCTSNENHSAEPSIADVGRVLEPVLGRWSPVAPYWLRPLEVLAREVGECRRLEDLERHRILERGREMKVSAGIRFFEPPALIAFTLYNIILRRIFFRIMRSDLDAIRANVVRLQKAGVKAVDARRAGLSARESLESVRRICFQWRDIFRSDYSAGHVFRGIKELRAATEAALSAPKEPSLLRVSPVRKNNGPTSASPAKLKPYAVRPPDNELDRALSVLEGPPENTVEEAYPELLDRASTGTAPSRYRVSDVILQIQAQTASSKDSNIVPISVRLDNSMIRLSSWEQEAFLRANAEAELAAVQSSVAVRLILQEAFDDFQDGYSGDLPAALTAAHADAGRMQETIAEAREMSDFSRVVYLSATAQRLIELIREAERALDQRTQ